MQTSAQRSYQSIWLQKELFLQECHSRAQADSLKVSTQLSHSSGTLLLLARPEVRQKQRAGEEWWSPWLT